MFQFSHTILLGVAEDVFADPLMPDDVEPATRQLEVFVEYTGAKIYNDPKRKLFYVVHGTDVGDEATRPYDFATLYWQRVLDHAEEQGWAEVERGESDA